MTLHYQAAVLQQARHPLQIETVAAAPLAPSDVLVRVRAAGLCHTDRFDEGYLEFLKDSLKEKGGDEEVELANVLREVEISWLKADIEEVSARTSRGELVPDFQLEYLNERIVKMGLANEGSKSDELKRPAM
jgi:hypothetical protein